MEENKKVVLKKVKYWEEIESQRPLSLAKLEERVFSTDDFKKWALLEETSWKQKSREIWLKEGDRNTKFFHRVENSHRRKNALNKIKINGQWLREIKQGMVEDFKNLLSDSGEWRASLMGLEFLSINDYEAASLERPFAEEEIKVALFDMSRDKAPSLNGFIETFWQCNWDIVKEDIISLFREFHANGRFVRSLNTTFLVLVPKKVSAEDLKDYRPIILVGSLYKWIAKGLSNRLKRVMGKLVNVAQNAFIEGRQMLDASWIANDGGRFDSKKEG